MIESEELVALVLGELDADTAAAVEDHVLGCASCAAQVEQLVALRDQIPALVRAGKVRLVVSPALIARLEREGLVTRAYELRPNATVACSVGATDVYTALHFLDADLRGVTRLDAVFEAPASTFRVSDLPFAPEERRVVFAQRADWIRTLASEKRTIRLVAVDDAGERELARYYLDHTAFAG